MWHANTLKHKVTNSNMNKSARKKRLEFKISKMCGRKAYVVNEKDFSSRNMTRILQIFVQ